MPIFRLTRTLAFPDPALAEEGLLAVGGDLSRERLLLAYANGIFPWYSRGEPILWWSPDPRMVLLPGEFHASRRLQRTIRQGMFHVTFDTAFAEVIEACASIRRRHERGTWITREMRAAYIDLHAAGYAHSVECRQEGQLVGGMYGVSLGSCFFGESMFSRVPNASKVAMVTLVQTVQGWGDWLIDCQVHNPHLESLGAREIPRTEFFALLRAHLRDPAKTGRWTAAASRS